MTKYYKRGLREFYAVSPERVIRIVNALSSSYVTVATEEGGVPEEIGTTKKFITEDALEGQGITRDEFKKQFEIASRLIVLDP